MHKGGCAKQASLFCRSVSDEEKKSLIIMTPEVERESFFFCFESTNRRTNKAIGYLDILHQNTF